MPALFFLAPLAMLVAFGCFGLAAYRWIENDGTRAHRRLVSYASAPSQVFDVASLTSSVLRGQHYSSIGIIDRLLRRGRGEYLAAELARAGSSLKPGEYLLIRWVSAAILGLSLHALTGALLLGLCGALGGYLLPDWFLRVKQSKRLRAFDNQLPDALTLLANGMQSGYSFLQGADAVAREMAEPIAGEFGRALREIRLGGEVDEALLSMYGRVPTPEFDLVVTAMIIQRQVGGDLPGILTTIAQTVRERHRILGEVRVLTAQERMSGYIVAALPVALVLLLALISPHYLGGMWASFGGKVLLTAGFIMESLGLLMIRRIVEIPV